MSSYKLKLSRRCLLKSCIAVGATIGGLGRARAHSDLGKPDFLDVKAAAPAKPSSLAFEYTKELSCSTTAEDIKAVIDSRFCIYPRHCLTKVSKDFRPDKYPDFRGTTELNGKEVGFRRMLCRCGKSKTMPFCDAS